MDKRTWAEINIDALAYNMKNIRSITNPDAEIMAVVKANAYGHGAVECAKILLDSGADRLGVATLDEAIEMRKCYPLVPIQILGSSSVEDAEDIVRYDITASVYTDDIALALSREAQKQNKKAKIHIKLDTGMSRIGFVASDDDNSDVINEIIRISELDGIETEGIFSHFATSDELDDSYTRLQFERFMSLCDELERKGLKIPVKHICNSAAIMMYPEYHLDMVRPGIILYGMYPSDDVDKKKLDLRYVMSLKSTVTYVKEINSGTGVSYGKEYIADGTAKIATVPIGYADGYSRLLAKNAKISVKGNLFPIAGRICMDQCMIDVTSVNNIDRGDEALIFGEGNVTVDDIARWLGTINYEITCMINRRVPRVYTKRGENVAVVDYLL